MEYNLTEIVYHVIDSESNRWHVSYMPAGTKWKCIVCKDYIPVLTDFITVNIPSFQLTQSIIQYAINGKENSKH